MLKPRITERGWPGHFICADKCLFRRNTLIEYLDVRIVVSTVGAMPDIIGLDGLGQNGYLIIGCDRFYETMAFMAQFTDGYWDADVRRTLSFDSEWQVDKIERDSDRNANKIHDNVVKEICDKLMLNELVIPEERTADDD